MLIWQAVNGGIDSARVLRLGRGGRAWQHAVSTLASLVSVNDTKGETLSFQWSAQSEQTPRHPCVSSPCS